MRVQTTLTPVQLKFAESIKNQFGLRNLGEALVFGFLNFWKEVKDNSYHPESLNLTQTSKEYEKNVRKMNLSDDIKMAAVSSFKILKSKHEI